MRVFRRKVLFLWHRGGAQADSLTPEPRQLSPDIAMETPSSSSPSSGTTTGIAPCSPIPINHETETSRAQQETLTQCLPYLHQAENPSGTLHNAPELKRQDHIKFLHKALQRFPRSFVGLDAARPWMVYWSLNGLWLLGEDVTQYRDR